MTIMPTTNCTDCFHPTCAHCNEPVRSNHHLLEDHPGTVAGSPRKGMCQACRRRGGPPLQRQQQAPTACITCDQPFRPYRTTIDAYPGTLLHHSGGYCSTCRRRADRAALYESQKEQKRFHLSDQELARIRAIAPDAYAYHMSRRPHREALGQKIGETA